MNDAATLSPSSIPATKPTGGWLGPALIFGILGLSIAMAVVSVILVTHNNAGDKEIPNAYEIGLKQDTDTANQMRKDDAEDAAAAAKAKIAKESAKS